MDTFYHDKIFTKLILFIVDALFVQYFKYYLSPFFRGGSELFLFSTPSPHHKKIGHSRFWHRNTVKNWKERFLVAQCKRKQSTVRYIRVRQKINR